MSILVVLAVPSNSFNQEKNKNSEVKEFCEVNFNITFPLSAITEVKGNNRHTPEIALEARLVGALDIGQRIRGDVGTIFRALDGAAVLTCGRAASWCCSPWSPSRSYG